MQLTGPRRRSRGFTMVELMVTLGVFAILSAIAMPTMRTVIANSQVRAAALSVQNGLAMARGEAIRLNTQVQFVLGTDHSWSVQLAADGTVLQQATGKEYATSVTITPNTTATVVFDAFGRKSAGPTQINIKSTNASCAATADPHGYKCLEIQLTTGGLARLCDPTLSLSSTEPKVCFVTPYFP